MIAIIYASEKFDIKSAKANIPEDIEVKYSHNPIIINNFLADYSRHIIERIIIEEGMKDISLMKGDCKENPPRIPVSMVKTPADVWNLYKGR